MPDPKKTPVGSDQDPSKETSTDRELDRIADEAAKKGTESEQRFDEEHGIFTE